MTNPIGGSKGARRFWQAIGAAPNAMMMHDRAGKIVMVNTQAERAFGCSRADLIGQPVEVLLPERLRGRHPELRETFFAGPQPRPMGVGRDLYGLKKDGSEFPVEIGLNPIETDEGTMVLTVIVDITARKAAEQALRESERRYSILVEGVTDYAIIMLDPNGIVTNWNRGAQRIKGYGAEEIVGQHFSRFYTDEDRAANEPQHGLEIAAQNGRYEAEALRVRKDGSRFWANVVIDAVKDDNDQLIGFTKITRDITERVQAAQKLEEARMAELAHLARVASLGEVTASIAHEVIQPIAAARINAASGPRFLSMNPPGDASSGRSRATPPRSKRARSRSTTRPTTAKTIRRRPIIPRRRASADVHARTNRGRSRSRRVSSGRSCRTSARCSPTCPPPATSAARKTARATKRPGPGTNSTSTWPAAKSRSPAC